MATAAVLTGLQLYLRQINDSPLLTAEEEKRLARQIIHQSDFAARERMVRFEPAAGGQHRQALRLTAG